MALCFPRTKTRRWLQNQKHLLAAEQTGQSWDPTVTAPAQDTPWKDKGKKKRHCEQRLHGARNAPPASSGSLL